MEIIEITDDNHVLSFSGRELRSILAGLSNSSKDTILEVLESDWFGTCMGTKDYTESDAYQVYRIYSILYDLLEVNDETS